MDDQKRERVRQIVASKITLAEVEGIDGSARIATTAGGVIDAIVAGIEAAQEPGPEPKARVVQPPAVPDGDPSLDDADPEPEQGEVDLPWRSTADGGSDYVSVSHAGADNVEVRTGSVNLGQIAYVRPSQIPHMARALFQAAGLEWPGGEESRVAVIQARRERDEAREEMRLIADDLRQAERERDEARAEVERIRKDMQALWHQTRDDDQLVTRLRSELRQARKLAPETRDLLGAAFRDVATPSPNTRAKLLQRSREWVFACCPDLPGGGE